MKIISLVAICFLFISNLSAQEEFNGCLLGWANAKVRFGAKGNGKADDTKAIQLAIDSLTQPLLNYNTGKAAYMVIYLPAGTYNISATLVLKGKIGVSIIGESPAITMIKWTGADNNTMLLANGSAYFKISRLTWNANGHKEEEAIGLHWKDKSGDERSKSAAPVNIEFSDNIFTGNCKFGISAGTLAGEGTGEMDSEVSIRRCVFYNCWAGIQIHGYNALDYWVWDCRFMKCSFGVKCNSGNYHVYRSYFDSCYSDVENTNGYYTSLRGCYSENDSHFSYDQGASSNPFKRVFQNNTVISPALIPVISYHLGKITLIDNFFDSASSKAVKAFVETGGWAGGHYEVLSVHNRYRNNSPVQFNTPPFTLYSYADTKGVTIPQNKSAFVNTQDKMPPLVIRQVLTVPAGAGSKKIQDLINQAVKLKGARPIVYFPTGKYVLEESLVIAEGADLQLVGDGYLYATVLMPAPGFEKGKALINVSGPTSIVIKDMQLGTFTNTMSGIDGIQFNNVDQPGSQAFIEQLYTNAQHSIHGKDLDYLTIQETNSFYSDGKLLTGGPSVQKGQGTAVLYCFGGQFAGLLVDKNAIAVMKDCWWEGAARTPLNFSGSGRITIDGAMIAPVKADSNTTISINKFAGKISLLNMYVQGGINVEKNDPKLSLLLWNIHFYHALDPLKFSSADATFRGAFMGLTTQCFTAEKKCETIFTVQDTFKGDIKQDAYVLDLLADDRAAMPRKYQAGQKGGSSILISRVSAGDYNTAIRFIK